MGGFERPSKLPEPWLTFGITQWESVFDYGFTQANVSATITRTRYYSAYRALIDALDRPAPRCFIKMDPLTVRLMEKQWPHDEVIIFTADIVGYYRFDYGSKFVVLCIDASSQEKTGYWFINFDNEEQILDFCDCLNRLFGIDMHGSMSSQASNGSIRMINCWCCGARNPIPKPTTGSSTSSVGSSSGSDGSTVASYKKLMPSQLTSMTGEQRNSNYSKKRKFRRA